MKLFNIKSSIFVLSAMLLIVSCDKKLDVPAQNSITPDQITTAADVRATLFGSYALLQSPNAFGERYLFAADLIADNGQINFIGTFQDYRDLIAKTQVTTNAIATGMWANGYTNINVVNTVLDKLDLITDADEKAVIEGEAKFIRGVVYYYLVNFYAQPYSAGNTTSNLGVPLMLEPVYSYDSTIHKVSRSTVEQTYQQIVSDLSEAASLLPDQNDEGRANRFAAEAFLARVYMAQGKYAEAATAASEVIASPLYGLGSFDAAFNNNGSEEYVFAVRQNNQSNAGTTNNGLPTFLAGQPVGRGDAQIPLSYFTTNFEATDIRGDYGYNGVSIAGQAGIYTAKWMEIYRDIPVVRLAEMYLTRGEANLRDPGADIGADPLDDINTVRERSGASTLVAVTADNFIAERFRELAFEGDRVWTLKRAMMNIDGRPYNDPKLVLPIPQREIDVNKNLVQNPTYN
jgi:starch-binding outer membrane protein, SusD/RagB family